MNETAAVPQATSKHGRLGRGVLMSAAGIAVLAFSTPGVTNGATMLGYALLMLGVLAVARSGR